MLHNIIRKILFIGLFLLPLCIHAQQYKTLVREDFGTSARNPSLRPDTVIAPGITSYTPITYAVTSPQNSSNNSYVDDGEYAVGDSLRPFGWYNGTGGQIWQYGPDHTTDPAGTKGYMMIINANPGKLGEKNGKYYQYSTSAFDIPGAQYTISFWAANILTFNIASSGGIAGSYKPGYIGLAVRNSPNDSTEAPYAAGDWILPRVTTASVPNPSRTDSRYDNIPWQNQTLAFDLPTSYSSGAPLYFNFFNSDPKTDNTACPTCGNDLVLDDILIQMRVITLTGTIFNDANKDGIKGTGEPGINGSDPTKPLFVYLTKADGSIISKAQVQPNGTYSLTGDAGVPFVANNIGLKLVVSPLNLPVDTGKITTASPPAGYSFVSENVNGSQMVSSGGVDGAMVIIRSDADISNINFGVNENPVSYAVTYNVPGKPAPTTLGPKPLIGSDATDQPTTGPWANKTVVINTLPKDFVLKYNNQTITAGQQIPNYDPKLLSIEPSATAPQGTQSTSFTYSVIDKAGLISNVSTYTVTFAQPLPIVFGTIEAFVKDDVLTVNWQSLSESNNNHYLIEGSIDGKNFFTIGQVTTQNGNSTVTQNYHFTTTLSGSGLMGGSIPLFIAITVFSLAISFSRNKRRLRLPFAIALIAFVTIFPACSKNDVTSVSKQSKLYIRIAQVDNDGTKVYSDVVVARNDD